MRFLAGECVDGALVASLRAAGHDVTYVSEIATSADDETVLQMAREEGRILLTEDKDFGEAVLRHRSCNAVNLLRIGMVGRDLEWSRLQHAIERFGAELEERYTVVEVSRFRFRPLC